MANLDQTGTSRYYDKLAALDQIVSNNLRTAKRRSGGGGGLFGLVDSDNPLLSLLTSLLSDDGDKPSDKPSSQDGDNPQTPPEEGQDNG